jgi:hypothetical protein
MRAEHRHELKTNVLAQWIAEFPQWTRENLRMIIYISVVSVLVLGSYIYHSYQKNVVSEQKRYELTGLVAQLPQSKLQILDAQAKGVDTSFTLIQLADDIQTAAQNQKNDQIVALGLIKCAEALRMELHYRLGTVSSQDMTAQINKAKADYTQAAEKCPGNPSLLAMAKFGLGLCEEELGSFERAKQIYNDIASDPLLEGTASAAAAAERRDTMADFQQEVVFKASPKPAVAGLVQPQIRVKPLDSNLPGQ